MKNRNTKLAWCVAVGMVVGSFTLIYATERRSPNRQKSQSQRNPMGEVEGDAFGADQFQSAQDGFLDASSANVSSSKTAESPETALKAIEEQRKRLEEQLLVQQVQVSRDQAFLVQIENDIENLKRQQDEYHQGTFKQRESQLLIDLHSTAERLTRAKERVAFSKRMFARGYLGELQFGADRFAAEQAREQHQLAASRLEAFQTLTRGRMKQHYQGELTKNQARLTVAQNTLALSELRFFQTEEQLANIMDKLQPEKSNSKLASRQ